MLAVDAELTAGGAGGPLAQDAGLSRCRRRSAPIIDQATTRSNSLCLHDLQDRPLRALGSQLQRSTVAGGLGVIFDRPNVPAFMRAPSGRSIRSLTATRQGAEVRGMFRAAARNFRTSLHFIVRVRTTCNTRA
jgi:hypothetical protein